VDGRARAVPQLLRAGYRRHAGYRQASLAGLCANTVFGLLVRAAVLTAVLTSAARWPATTWRPTSPLRPARCRAAHALLIRLLPRWRSGRCSSRSAVRSGRAPGTAALFAVTLALAVVASPGIRF
jgi:hypothetical protein